MINMDNLELFDSASLDEEQSGIQDEVASYVAMCLDLQQN